MSEKSAMPPAPILEGATKIFYEHIANGEFYLQYDSAAKKWIFPPREAEAIGAGGSVDWKPASGKGTVYSWTIIERIMHPAFDKPPYVIALVRLDEGPILMTRLLDVDKDKMNFDLAVRFDPSASKSAMVPFPLFRLV